MKRLVILVASAFAGTLLAATDSDTISTDIRHWNWRTPKRSMNVLLDSGHIQGLCCDETGVYFSYAGGITKFDWKGNKLAETTGPKHLGDSFVYKGKVYAVFGLWKPVTIGGKKMTGAIGVYDATTLKLEKMKHFPEFFDGCCVINDILYTSPDRWGGNKGQNKVALIQRFDLDLNDLGITEIDFGFKMHYGVQTMATDGMNLFCCCYGGPDNTAVLTPDLRLIGTYKTYSAEGFCRVPEAVIGKTRRPYFVRTNALGGNMQGWWKDPTNNPPQVELRCEQVPNPRPVPPPLAVEYAGTDPAVKFAVTELYSCLEGARGTIRFAEDATLGPQEWKIEGKNSVVTLSGRDGHAQLYAALTFLEKYAGCRWYAPDTTVKPNRWGWRLPNVSERGKPAMLAREMYIGGDGVDGTWRLRNKETKNVPYGCGFFNGAPEDCHTFGPYYEAIKGKLTPEMMGRNASGKPSGQFCPSHPAVRHLVAEQMKAYIRADRAKRAREPRYAWPSVYELSQDDGGGGRCFCTVCKKINEAAGGRASAANLAFAGAVAEEVAREFPDIIVRTFAYAYTERAPKNDYVAPKNLAIRFCRSFLFQPLTAETDNGRALAEWGSHVKYKFVWSYWRSFSGPLFPAVKPREDIGKEMRFCRDQGVCGYFAEDEAPLSRSFSMLQHWLFLKFAENPDQDVMKLADEFMQQYYGKAAPALGQYLTYLEKREKENYAALDRSFIAGLDSGTLAMYVQREYLDRAFFETVNRLLDEAERLVAGDERLARHVAQERLVVDRALLDVASTIGLTGSSPEFSAAVRRIRATAPAQIASAQISAANRPARMARAAIEAEVAARLPAPVPSELKGRRYVEWPVDRLDARGHVSLVKDPDSVFGYSATVENVPHKLPYTIGAYDPRSKDRGELHLGAKDIPTDEKFHLYRLGTVDLICESRLFFDWTWRSHIWVPPFGLQTDRREVWASVKLTGPTYVKGSKSKDGIFIERVFFVRPKTNGQK